MPLYFEYRVALSFEHSMCSLLFKINFLCFSGLEENSWLYSSYLTCSFTIIDDYPVRVGHIGKALEFNLLWTHQSGHAINAHK